MPELPVVVNCRMQRYTRNEPESMIVVKSAALGEGEGCAGKRVPGRRMVEENPCLGDGCLPPFFAYAVSV